MTATLPTNHQAGPWGQNFLDWLNATAIYEFALNGATSVGATTGVVDRSAALITASRNLVAIVDPGTAQSELREVGTISSSTLTFDRALDYAHSVGARVILSSGSAFSPWVWGAKGDDSTDDWTKLQQACNQTSLLLVQLEGMGNFHRLSQPVCVYESRWQHMALKPTAGFAPVDTTGAMVMTAQNSILTFTASASTDTFTTPSNHNIGGVGNMVVFNNPGGETLPGGVVSGRIYFVKTIPTGTTFTIAATTGGATIDITSDGTGWLYGDMLSLCRTRWDGVHLFVDVANLNALQAGIQQPAYMRDLRIDTAAGTGVGLTLQGQLGNFYNTEINSMNVGLRLMGGAVGMSFFGMNMNPSGGTTGIKIEDALLNSFFGLWTENIATHVEIGSGLTRIDGWLTGNNGTNDIVKVTTSDQSSYSFDGLYINGIPGNVINDTVRGFTLSKTAAGIDTQGYLNGFWQPWGSDPYVIYRNPDGVLTEFRTSNFTVSATWNANTVFLVSSDAGDVTVTLPTAVGNTGKSVMIKRLGTAPGANKVTVATVSSQTIDQGPTSLTMGYMEYVELYADGFGNWNLRTGGRNKDQVTALAYSATIATNSAFGNIFTIVATNGTAFTISSPTNLVKGQSITYDILNSSGGAMGAVTWGATFKLDATGFVNPANTKRKTIRFYYDGTNLVQVGPTSADI